MIVVPLVAAALGVLQTYFATVVGQRVMQDSRNRLAEHLQVMSLRFFTGTRTGDLQSRPQNDVGGVQNGSRTPPRRCCRTSSPSAPSSR